MTKQNIEYWVIPPECDAEFVAHMENQQFPFGLFVQEIGIGRS
jgi:hypothetical protein